MIFYIRNYISATGPGQFKQLGKLMVSPFFNGLNIDWSSFKVNYMCNLANYPLQVHAYI